MDFSCEIKQVQARKTVSNDMVYKLVVETENPMVMDLGKLPSDSLFEINLTLHNSTQEKSNKEDAGYQQI